MTFGTHRILIGDVLDGLRTLADGSARCCVTSPPYWGLRDYGVEGQLGLESTPDEYVSRMVAVFREVRRVLADDGTLWLNIGDSYAANRSYQVSQSKRLVHDYGQSNATEVPPGCKPKDLVGIPWLLAFALRADGWYLRSDIIWCLSGGTWLYVRTDEGGICLMTVKDLYRLDPATVRLWNGKEWTRLLGMSKSKRRGGELEITLRSGERIACTPTHRFPIWGGARNVPASELKVGDTLERVRLPEPTYPTDTPEIGTDAAWLCGLYIAEGSRSGDTIQIAGHAKEEHRWQRLQWIAHKYGGSATRTVKGNRMDIRLYGKILNGIIDQFVSGKTAHNKGFAPAVWRCSNNFIESMMDGYLAGDGHRDDKNNRWRLGFCRNYNLERDIRTACARLGWRLTLNMASVSYKGTKRPAFRGELRKSTMVHHNCKDPNEIVAIGKARCRDVYDLGVADEPHLFALASGILTHNSKPNPMPESVTDRPTKSHEYIFLLSKSQRYYFDAEAVKESAGGWRGSDFHPSVKRGDFNGKTNDLPGREAFRAVTESRNIRTVWPIATQPYPESHFATFPEAIPERCIKAGSSERGKCPACGAAWVRKVERTAYTPEVVEAGVRHVDASRADKTRKLSGKEYNEQASSRTVGWSPSCDCPAADPIPDTVLEPFAGSGTTLLVACRLGRDAVGCELNPEYAAMAERRIGRGLRPATFRDEIAGAEPAGLFQD
jgi:DNA modification methylase